MVAIPVPRFVHLARAGRASRAARRNGISYYNKSRKVDIPLIATFSTDRTWVVASFTRETGNVWSNPELTCQHVDPQTSLAPGQDATLEVKILVLRGSLNNVLEKALLQRNFLNGAFPSNGVSKGVGPCA